MDSDKLLRNLELELQTFQAHIKRMRKHGKLHKLDVDLLQEKTRDLYDQLFTLEDSLAGTPEKQGPPAITLPEKMPEAEIPEVVESKKYEAPGTIVPLKESEKKVVDKQPEKQPKAEPETKPEPAPEPKPEPAPVPNLEKEEPPVIQKEKEKVVEKEQAEPKDPVAVEQKVKEEKVPGKETPPPAAKEKVESSPEEAGKPQSAFDLFTSSAGETIGDKLGGVENTSIADQMQKSTIADLKQAIGINEKFLFINELFNGDLGRYNKAVEEFNALQSLEGVNAHLVELKVSNQWSEDNEAYQKLKALLERKFG